MLNRILENSSFHAVFDDSTLDALRFAGANGFAGIQLAVELPHLDFENIPIEERMQIAEFCRAHRLRVTLHAPDTMVSFLETNRILRDGIFNYFDGLFEFAEQIGSPLITVHPGKISTCGTDTVPRRLIPPADLPYYRPALRENLSRLVDLNQNRFLLCIENFHMDTLVMETLQPFLAAGTLFLCWDLAKSDETVEPFFWSNLSSIRQVHLHDSDSKHSHKVVGTGQIDFLHYLPRLAEANIVDFCHEVRPREKALESLRNLESLLSKSRILKGHG
jgi:sugar phosphate isomerase/epimerase